MSPEVRACGLRSVAPLCSYLLLREKDAGGRTRSAWRLLLHALKWMGMDMDADEVQHYCTVLYCTVLYCTVLYCIVQCCLLSVFSMVSNAQHCYSTLYTYICTAMTVHISPLWIVL